MHDNKITLICLYYLLLLFVTGIPRYTRTPGTPRNPRVQWDRCKKMSLLLIVIFASIIATQRPAPDYYKISRHCIHFREKKDILGDQGP